VARFHRKFASIAIRVLIRLFFDMQKPFGALPAPVALAVHCERITGSPEIIAGQSRLGGSGMLLTVLSVPISSFPARLWIVSEVRIHLFGVLWKSGSPSGGAATQPTLAEMPEVAFGSPSAVSRQPLTLSLNSS
jgi:hypothetical protein